MSENFADRLLAAIEKKGSPICVGIDPMLEMFPPELAPPPGKSNDLDVCIDAIFAFTTRILKIVADHVPIVKFQSAYFEKYRGEGVEAYYSLIQEAKHLGLLVIGDVKRGDIGTTSAAYAEAHLAPLSGEDDDESDTPDAITINPFCGLDTIEPFIKVAHRESKGLFVLVRTSNPRSAALQDQTLLDGRTYSEMLADSLRPMTEADGLIGSSGYSCIGAVVGATQAHTMTSLRQRLPRSIFLLPGYGTQGATGEMTRAAFSNGQGAIVSASRSILYAHREPKYSGKFGNDWERCVQASIEDMKCDLSEFVR
jgi:orotidine-5'-phosphate decarboxylase